MNKKIISKVEPNVYDFLKAYVKEDKKNHRNFKDKSKKNVEAIKFSILLPKKIKLEKLNLNSITKEFMKEIDHIQKDIISKLSMEETQEKFTKSFGSCPKCNDNVIKIKGKFGEFYTCQEKGCNFSITNYTKVNDNDVELLLRGSKTSVKNQVSKVGKKYKCRYKLIGSKIEMEFA